MINIKKILRIFLEKIKLFLVRIYEDQKIKSSVKILERIYQKENRWRDITLPDLKRQTRIGNDITIVERLLHTTHNRLEDEIDILERTYPAEIKVIKDGRI
jgi:hypothetical protein